MEHESTRRDLLKHLGGAGALAAAATVLAPKEATAQTPPAYYPPGNILNYGADPSGNADSASAINEAIDKNWAVYVPAGTYKIRSPIKFQSPLPRGRQAAFHRLNSATAGLRHEQSKRS